MSAIYQSRLQADMATERMKAFAQPQRLMILSRLLDGEQIVGEIERVTGIGQPALSQQLAELRRAGLVTMRRATKQVHYRLADEDVMLCVRTIEAMFGAGKDKSAALERVIVPLHDSAAARATVPTSAAAFARIG